ncbi:MAG: hypothetical protein RL557_1068 [archaeon]|jgi:putative oxidoreductase
MKVSPKNAETMYVVFRVIVGLTFLLHGIMKIPGLRAGTTEIMSLMALAALIEVVGGAFLIIGLWVKPTATIAAIEMAYAFLVVHVYGNAWNFNPLANKGEPALLFFAAFLVLIAYGAGKWAIDKK